MPQWWMLPLVLVAACGGEEDEPVALSIVSPEPGTQLARTVLDEVGALVAAVDVGVEVSGRPARIALALGDTEVGEIVDGHLVTTLPALGPATLTATALDDSGAPLATATVDVVVVDPELADCHAWLDLYGVGYDVGPTRAGVKDPVTASMPINGIAYRVSGAARQTMFGDCSLIKSLAQAASHWRRRQIVEVTDLGVYNYRCKNNNGTPPNCPTGLSEHSFGNAIDLNAFKAADGTTYSVTTDWVIDPDAQKTCMADTVEGKDRFLHEMICELKAAGVWTIVLTPNYNALHRDHFHVDLTANADTINRTDPSLHEH